MKEYVTPKAFPPTVTVMVDVPAVVPASGAAFRVK